ncbi:MAG TPA: hypothetical protein VK602_17055, partial [Phyllobacterium sp.]|nr:hypothetical protein [Phyllobacterium sp.]
MSDGWRKASRQSRMCVHPGRRLRSCNGGWAEQFTKANRMIALIVMSERRDYVFPEDVKLP